MRIRLLPIVLVATTALLIFKGVGLITHGSYVLTGTEFASAQSMDVASSDSNSPGNDLTPSEDAAARRAADSLFSRAEPTPVQSDKIDATPLVQNRAGEKVEFGSNDGTQLTERAVLERLGERRIELDQRAQQLSERENLVQAAETRLNERIATLQELESKVQSLVDEKNAMQDDQFAGLVNMYETMKPAEAATVFNTLDIDVLFKLATNINPRKMSPILADMNTEKAQELTLRLAEADQAEPDDGGMTGDLSGLPQIVGQ